MSNYKEHLKKEGDRITFSRLNTLIIFDYEYGRVNVMVTNRDQELANYTTGDSDRDPAIMLADEANYSQCNIVSYLWQVCEGLVQERWLTQE